MKKFSVKLGLGSIFIHRDLLRSLVKREVEMKYRASILGKFWVVIYPIMMLGVYTFVFGSVFGSRWSGHGDLIDFVPMLYCGLIVHSIFAETVSKAPNIIVNNPNYVKKVIFPLELLPVGSLLTALFNAFISFTLLMIMVLIFKHSLQWTLIFLPLVILPLVLFSIGFAWLIAALGVFFRDIEQFIGVFMSILLFLSPVFYSIDSIPLIAQKILSVNPLTYPIEDLRKVALLGELPNWKPLFMNLLFSFGTAWCGLWVFEKTRPAFADVV
ncbi:ABC transporter permease [Ferrovum sp. PN-J185]|uniref:ABC transporter permease n=1 Tax=Ferrovum sp. PN-J185 TaxID=1356306 RepID=UPI00079BE5A4|nr:ABC transporter permease [Ferrovum sp. PN-J185]KXW55836.1 teichoic acid translocation permease protein TagG [Ferrovum sp. PN-J185]